MINNLVEKVVNLLAPKQMWPKHRPYMSLGAALTIAQNNGINIEKEVCIINVRGFYNKKNNKRGVYDDAGFILSPSLFESFNVNTDPGAYREKIATLDLGVWTYKIGIHGLNKLRIFRYKALVQAEEVVVLRDKLIGKFKGFFGINYHKGANDKPSSLGCQTVVPPQWPEFIGTVETQMKKYGQKTIKLIVVEMRDDYI